jgi:hypothetical protein
MFDMAGEVRDANFCMLGGPAEVQGLRHRRGRGQNFLVDWIEARDAARQAFGRADALRRLSDRG